MLWFSGARPVSVYAQEIHPGPSKYPEGGWAMARLDSDAVCSIESVWYLPESTPYAIDARMEVIGTEGALYINCGEAGLEIHDAQGDPNARHGLLAAGISASATACCETELRYFADCVREESNARADHARGVPRRRGLDDGGDGVGPVGQGGHVLIDRKVHALKGVVNRH